jgi:hypothetical protein
MRLHRYTRVMAPLELLRGGPGGVTSPLEDPGRLLLRALPELAGRDAKRISDAVDANGGSERLCCNTQKTMVRL